MGKSRQRNRGKGGQRPDPIAKPVKPPSDPELAALRDQTVLPVLKNLQSAEPKNRTAAAGAIANIILDQKCRKLLLREQVVHIVLNETLHDSSIESRAAGWEILKVLTQEEEADFCVHLYRIDILTAIEYAASKITEALTGPNAAQFSKAPKAEQRFAWIIAEALVTIVSALAEAQDEILESVVKNQQILRLLLILVSSNLTTPEVVNSALSCMMTLSEDNRQFVEAILGDGETQCFKHLMAFKTVEGLRGVLACGVLHNVFSVMQWHDSQPGRDNTSDAVLVATLANTLKSTQMSSNKTNGHSGSSPVEVLQLALEILASIGTGLEEYFVQGSNAPVAKVEGFDDNEDVGMDVDDDHVESEKEAGSDDDSMDEEELEADMERVTGVDDYPDESDIDDMPTFKALIQQAVPQVVKIFKSCAAQDEATSLIRSHALSALNNLAWATSILDFSEGQSGEVLKAWIPTATMIWKETVAPVLSSDTSDVSLAIQVTGLAWAIARTLRHRTPLSGDEHKKFMSLYHASKNLPLDEDPFQSLGVKCLGVLGQLALDPAPLERNRDIGVFLLAVVASLPNTPLVDAVEALSQLYDIYGDENHACDKEVFWRDGFLRHFEEAVPKVKAAIKKVDKRKATELRQRADEAALNLPRFIQYKQKNKP